MSYRITTNKDEMDFDAIHHYLSRSYWAEKIPKNVMLKAIENSLCFGVLQREDNGNSKQVGFARLITDSATFAYLADVYVLEEHRSKGLSKQMMKKIVEHPQLQGLRRIMLATRDAHGLYEQFGFTPLADEKMFMQLWAPSVYQ
jgi:N-acetylglutamate synthase-like GNAT family acetyltransferase